MEHSFSFLAFTKTQWNTPGITRNKQLIKTNRNNIKIFADLKVRVSILLPPGFQGAPGFRTCPHFLVLKTGVKYNRDIMIFVMATTGLLDVELMGT